MIRFFVFLFRKIQRKFYWRRAIQRSQNAKMVDYSVKCDRSETNCPTSELDHVFTPFGLKTHKRVLVIETKDIKVTDVGAPWTSPRRRC